jgi:arginase family enzyme
MPGKTCAFFFPFDLFGSGGTADGPRLLADAFREMLADNKREKVPTRARAYAGKVRVEEFHFDTMPAYESWRSEARKAFRNAIQRGEFVLWMAGNHLGVLPVYEELGRKADAVVIQLDAHLDIYNLTDCTAEMSHGNFLLHSSKPLPALINIGHRELLLRPKYISTYYRHAFAAADLALDPSQALECVRQVSAAADSVLIDLDCDVFDPAYFPGLTHPLPFGMSPQLVMRFLDAAWCGNIVGLAVSEFDPGRDQGDRGLATLVWLLEYVLLRRYETRTRR